MYNFVMLHELWMVLTIGVIRGLRRGWPTLRDSAKASLLTIFTEDTDSPVDFSEAPPAEHPDFIAVDRTVAKIIRKARAGKTYHSLDELITDLDEELKFQRIAIREETQFKS
jgi:hypothetical protein